MILALNYGKSKISLSFPEETVMPECREPEFGITRANFVRDMLRYLPREGSCYQNVAIVVSDKTRLCGYPQFLPWLTELLLKQGAQKEHITFYIAYGTHPPQTEEESFASYGSTYHEFRFVHHNCKDEALFTNLGVTLRGTPVPVRHDILASSLIITFGSISHHYFAGFGGGRKLLFPGLASRKAVYHNHGLFLDRERRSLSSGCQPGNLQGNPVAEDLEEIDTYLPPRVSIHGILNTTGKVCRLIVGQSYNDFVAACRLHDSFFRYGADMRFDMVVASSGGYPKDINFIQAHKSVHHAAAFVKDGGVLVMLSECVDKIASDYFMKYLEAGSFESAFSMLEDQYEGNGGTALAMMQKTQRIRIFMVTSLDEHACKTLGVTKVTDTQVQQMIDSEKGSIAVISNASVLVA
jgi:nickel-dependent lactate racemase